MPQPERPEHLPHHIFEEANQVLRLLAAQAKGSFGHGVLRKQERIHDFVQQSLLMSCKAVRPNCRITAWLSEMRLKPNIWASLATRYTARRCCPNS